MVNNYKSVNLEEWNRKDTYLFFKDYEDPFFNLCTEVDVNQLYNFCKRESLSFFLTSLHCSIVTANQIREFRIRKKDDQLVEYDSIFPGATVSHDDGTFSFCYFDYYKNLSEFIEQGKLKMEEEKASKSFDGRKEALDLIHYSVTPWVAFTSIKHARHNYQKDTVPKIVFGKLVEKEGRKKMPISIAVNHSIMDGYHVGLYLEQFQAALDRF